MTTHSAWLQTTGQGRVDTRLALSTGMAPAGNLTSRAGIVADGGLALQQVSAMQCQISPGRAYVQGTTAQGAYPIAVDAAVPLTVPDGDPQYNRIDVIVLKIQDDQFDGSGQTQASVTLIAGTPAASPVPPTVPQASLPLFQISVPTKVSAGTGGIAWSTAVTDLRVYTAALGGIVPAGTTPWTPPAAAHYSDLNGLLQRYNGSAWTPVYDPTTVGNLLAVTSTTRPASPPVGKQVYETDTGRVSAWTGSAWVTVYDPAAGFGTWTQISLSNNNFSHLSGRPLSIRLCPGGIVQMSGGIVMNTVISGGCSNTLPNWAIPANTKFFAPAAVNPSTTLVPMGASMMSYLSIYPYMGSTTAPAGTTIYFDGISYPTNV